jgi:nitrogen fixation NifU-like protein
MFQEEVNNSMRNNTNREGFGAGNAATGLVGLYQDILIEHSKKPRFKFASKPQNCTFCQEGKNPLCGDSITIFVTSETVQNNSNGFANVSVENSQKNVPHFSVQFAGSGCSISQASASMLCSKLQNTNYFQAKELCSYAESIYTGKAHGVIDEDDIEEDIQALSGVSKFPVRVKCAALAWKTLELVLENSFTHEGLFKEPIAEVHYSEAKKMKTILD